MFIILGVSNFNYVFIVLILIKFGFVFLFLIIGFVRLIQKAMVLVSATFRRFIFIVRSDFYINGVVGASFNNFFFKLNFFFFFYIKMAAVYFLNNKFLKGVSKFGSNYTFVLRVTLASMLFVILFFINFFFIFFLI